MSRKRVQVFAVVVAVAVAVVFAVAVTVAVAVVLLIVVLSSAHIKRFSCLPYAGLGLVRLDLKV